MEAATFANFALGFGRVVDIHDMPDSLSATMLWFVPLEKV
jgi:hypothetical protein